MYVKVSHVITFWDRLYMSFFRRTLHLYVNPRTMSFQKSWKDDQSSCILLARVTGKLGIGSVCQFKWTQHAGGWLCATRHMFLTE
jgi:hypothetical protein